MIGHERATTSGSPHASTFSIVACDLDRRRWGVAVVSRFPAVGALCAWAQAEVGAVATQSWIKASHGERGLRLMSEGLTAPEALDRLLTDDEGSSQRQLGLIDCDGRTASHTGEACLGWAGARAGPGYAAQGNMLVSEDTIARLAETFEAGSELPLADRMMRALVAAEAAGGDRRGKQAAALRVVGSGGGYGGADIVVDLRVDDHHEPIAELERLLELHEFHFGSTPEDQWLPVDDGLRAELRDRLEAMGHASGDLVGDLENWAAIVNLEERVEGADRIDPVVLEHLRRTGSASESPPGG
ncbi:MAG: DUF1028 domain-containing protein [Solirubrobacterales bacterium]